MNRKRIGVIITIVTMVLCSSCGRKETPADSNTKEVLTLTTPYLSDELRSAIDYFNEENETIQINPIRYSEYADCDNFTDGLSKLNMDIISGKAPDIMIIDSEIPFESYLHKGLFEALDSYMLTDSEISQDDFLENIISLGQKDECLYSIIPMFYVETCIASEEQLHGNILTLSNYKELCSKNNIDHSKMFGSLSKQDSSDLLLCSTLELVDWKENTCNFECSSFINMLEYINSLPSEINTDLCTSSNNEESLLSAVSIYGIEDYLLSKRSFHDDTIVFNGFPAANSGISYIHPELQMAISSKCKNKKAAWQFVRYFLTDEYQQKIDSYIPLSKKAFDKMLDTAENSIYYINEDNEIIISKKNEQVKDMKIDLGSINKTEAGNFKRLVETTSSSFYENTKIASIIFEEAKHFFNGETTAENVATIVQSKVSIYLCENK